MHWKHNKDFAFTIIDDTDRAVLGSIRPVYEFLKSIGIFTTKTVWVHPPRDRFPGDTLHDTAYLAFIQSLRKEGFEIQLHNVGSGSFPRADIITGLDLFREAFGTYPSMQINHASNPDNLYSGYKRFGRVLNGLMQLLAGEKRRSYGDEPGSIYFWGDIARTRIRFIRNRVFNGINTLRCDPKMPFRETGKKYANYWFSSSDGHTIDEFNKLVTPIHIEKLKRQGGLCIVYTHFADGFVDGNGELDADFKRNMQYLSKQNGWFAPASEMLDYLLEVRGEETASQFYLTVLDIKWLFQRFLKKIKSGR
jgi:hypothetical protein